LHLIVQTPNKPSKLCNLATFVQTSPARLGESVQVWIKHINNKLSKRC